MPVDSSFSITKGHRLALSIGLFLFAVFLFTYRGGFHSIDEVSIFAVTESIVKFGQVNTDQIAWTQWTTSQAEAQGFFGADGHVYSKKGLALSLVQAPLYWLALYLTGLGMLQTVSMLNALVTAATAALLALFLWRARFSTAAILITSLIFGLATIAFVYAKYLFSEPLAAFLLLLTVYALYAFRQEQRLPHLALAGLAAGFAVLTRANNLLLLPCFALYLLWAIYTTPRDKPAAPPRLRHYIAPLIVFGCGLAVPALVLLAYNSARSGNPLQTGYDLTLFTPNVFLGFYKLLFSPLRGLFIYSPILLLSLPGWWLFRRRFPAEGWLLVSIMAITVALFSAWSSGEGLSWGSRFLVPLVPLFAICLAPVVQIALQSGSAGNPQTPVDFGTFPRVDRILTRSFLILLPISLLVQILGVVINPWIFLSRLQADFGGEFFLENTAALYDFRYSQIVGQLQSWSLANSDLAWLRWGFDATAFSLSLGLVLFSGWLVWDQFRTIGDPADPGLSPGTKTNRRTISNAGLLLLGGFVAMLGSYGLLIRYFQTDQQFGPVDDGYTQALGTIELQTASNEPIITVAQYHYHVPMNRFKARIPLIGFAQQSWPPPQTALPLLNSAADNRNIWLVTVGFPPAAPDNATEQWLAKNTFKASDQWLPNDVRLARFSPTAPSTTRPIGAILGNQIELIEVNLVSNTNPDQPLPVEFIWQPIARPENDYNLFLQLLHEDGTMVAQHDGPLQGGYTIISQWKPGQAVISRHALILPANLTPGDYRLIAGLYNSATGQRLSNNGGQNHDFVELGPITITRSSDAGS